jgi:hypothetical protein
VVLGAIGPADAPPPAAGPAILLMALDVAALVQAGGLIAQQRG